MYALFNGELIWADQALISAAAEGCAYGFGIFETLKVAGGRAFFVEEHCRRFSRSCKELAMPLPLDFESIRGAIGMLILANGLGRGTLKILYTKDHKKFDLLLTTKENPYPEAIYDQGFWICMASAKRNPYAKLTYIKSSNYMENLLEKEQAAVKGFDEAIFLNTDGYLSEGACTNLFFVKEGIVFTPSIACGLLPGILREKVIGLIHRSSLRLETGQFREDDLWESDEVFLTNSRMEIMPVSKIHTKSYDLEENRITRRLRKEFYHAYCGPGS